MLIRSERLGYGGGWENSFLLWVFELKALMLLPIKNGVSQRQLLKVDELIVKLSLSINYLCLLPYVWQVEFVPTKTSSP